MRESLLEMLCPPGARDERLELVPLEGESDQVLTGILCSPDGRWWWVAGGVPRILPASLYRRPDLEQTYATTLRRLGLPPVQAGPKRATLEARTIDRFGSEWLRFRDWGWHESCPSGADPLEYHGGLLEHTRAAFRSKTFLEGRVAGKRCLDAGCGNGRFTRAALECGADSVIGVDLGWAVDAFHEHHRLDPRAHVVQASLFDLPLREVDVAFSIGVLMHTGDAPRAFRSIAEIVRPGGEVAVRLYHRGNWAYEVTDRVIRGLTTRLTKSQQAGFAEVMAGFGRSLIEDDRGRLFGPSRMRWYSILRNWPTQHHNIDWWSAPVASHHAVDEVCGWGIAAGLKVAQCDPVPGAGPPGFWNWPEALTVRFERPITVSATRQTTPRSLVGRPVVAGAA